MTCIEDGNKYKRKAKQKLERNMYIRNGWYLHAYEVKVIHLCEAILFFYFETNDTYREQHRNDFIYATVHYYFMHSIY